MKRMFVILMAVILAALAFPAKTVAKGYQMYFDRAVKYLNNPVPQAEASAMANPTAKQMTYDVTKGFDQAGACRDFWMRFPGLRAASDQDSGGNDVIYYLENPFYKDLVILEALVVIRTEDAQDGDIDVGIEDDAAGTDSLSGGALIVDSIVNTAAGVFAVLAPNALACTQARQVWKAKGSSTGAFLTVTQNGDADVSSLRWDLALRVVPYDDLINSNVELGAITVG